MSKAHSAAVVDVFFALGDSTRLSVVQKLGAQGAQSATLLSEGAKISRQAIVKHLQVLANAGLVTHARQGREVLYALEPGRLEEARSFIDSVSSSWDRAIERLRYMVEEPPKRAATRGRRRKPS